MDIEITRAIFSKAQFHVELGTRISTRNTIIYIAPYGTINHQLVNMSSNCNVKSGLIDWREFYYFQSARRFFIIFHYMSKELFLLAKRYF